MKKKPDSKKFLTQLFKVFMPMKNRREFKRVAAPFLIKYTVIEKGVGNITNVRDLSVGGALFTADQPLLKGAKLSVDVNLPTSQMPVKAQAEVIRVSKIPNSDMYRIATRFTSLLPDDRKEIRVLIERMARDKHAKGLVNRKKRIWAVR